MIKPMKKLLRSLYLFLGILFGIISFSAFAVPCDANSESDLTSTEKLPEDYIEFESVLDGKCQNLSIRGKLRVVKNHHPDKTIKYRFYRIFAGKRQAGMAMGRIEPGEGPVKLGCTKVDGHDQTWEIKVVTFVE